jgi:hypothetical protein
MGEKLPNGRLLGRLSGVPVIERLSAKLTDAKANITRIRMFFFILIFLITLKCATF